MHNSDERGLTLVEVIVATTLLGIGIAGAASVLAATSRTVSTADQRAQASHLATAEIETLRAMPYQDVTIDPSARGYVASFDGRVTVVPNQLPLVNSPTPIAIRPAAVSSALVLPLETIQIGAQEFLVTRHITWQETGQQGRMDPFGYKVVNVFVEWEDSTGVHQVQQESGLFAGAGS